MKQRLLSLLLCLALIYALLPQIALSAGAATGGIYTYIGSRWRGKYYGLQ